MYIDAFLKGKKIKQLEKINRSQHVDERHGIKQDIYYVYLQCRAVVDHFTGDQPFAVNLEKWLKMKNASSVCRAIFQRLTCLPVFSLSSLAMLMHISRVAYLSILEENEQIR